MAFGFDPSIILGAKQYQAPDPGETMRTLGQLAGMDQQRQLHQATLAAMLQKQGQEKALSDVYRQYADNPSGLSAGLMRIGRGQEAYAAQDQQAQMSAQQAALQKAAQEHISKQAELLARPLVGIKDQAGLDAAFAAYKRAGIPDDDLKTLPREYNPQTAPLFQQIAQMGIPAEKVVENVETAKHHRAEEAKPAPAMIVLGEGGTQYLTNPRKPGAPAVPITDADGNPILKPQAGGDGPSRGKVAADRLAFEKAQHQIQGWEPTDPTNPQEISKEEAQGFRKALSAQTQIREKIGEAKKLLAEMGRVPSSLTTNGALAQQKIAELKPLLLLAGSFGNMTQGHVHVLEEAGSQKPTEFYNALNPERLPALLDGMLESTDKAVNASGASLGRRKAAPGGGNGSGPAPAAGGAHPQDTSALQWAKDHADDPRAAAILKANGVVVGAPSGTTL